MDTTTDRPSRLRRGVVLSTLLLGTFMAGCAEQLVVGLLPLISDGLGVSVPAAGALVSSNALGLALGGPLLTAATIRMDRRRILIGSIVLFALLLVVPVVVPQYELLLLARFLGGALQGLFMAAAFTTAVASASPHRAGQAMPVVIAGFSVATVVGLPLGVVVGAALGWRGALRRRGRGPALRRAPGGGRTARRRWSTTGVSVLTLDRNGLITKINYFHDPAPVPLAGLPVSWSGPAWGPTTS